MVTSQYHTTDATHGNPAGSFQRLGSLVDEQSAELLTVQQAVG